jgi:hypothetical protein
VDANPGVLIQFRILQDDGPPGLTDSQTFNGFANELALGITLEVEPVQDLGSPTITIHLTVPGDTIGELGLFPEEADIHVLDDATNVWQRTGNEFQGDSDPTSRVGDYGFFVSDDDSVTYWAVLDHLSVFAIGQSQDGPSQSLIETAGIDDFVPADNEDDTVTSIDTPTDMTDADTDLPPSDDPPADDTPNDTQGVNDPLSDESDTTDDLSPLPAAPGCGTGAASCGAVGMFNLFLIHLGTLCLRKTRRRSRFSPNR